MNWLTRIQMFLDVKTNAVLDNVEDPRQTLEFAYGRQQELLREVKRGLVEVATSRKQLEHQAAKLRARVPELEAQARQAITGGREDLARLALQRKQNCLAELARLDQQLAELAQEERKLAQSEQQFAARVGNFRIRRETLAAQYTAAEAQVRLHETLSGLSGETTSIGLALERAEEKIDRMRARASALDALLDQGLLTSPPPTEDGLERELREMAASQAVDAELLVLKQQTTIITAR